MTTRGRLAVALAAGLWGFACPGMASAEYRTDPAVRAAIGQKLKTSDDAEIRKRWGVFADLVGKVWLHQVEGSEKRAWFDLRWAVQGAVMDYAVGWCRNKDCEVRKAVLVHRPAEEDRKAKAETRV